MQSYKGRFEPTRFADLTVTVDFHCHSACRFCIVQEGMNRFRGVPFDTFKRAVDDNGRAPRYRRVTFTGGEVTLERSLFDYVRYARDHGGFEHIRLQTNGRLLADRSFAERLVEAGIDEFFVSLHGPDAAVQDHISQRPGSFDEAWQGLRNLQALGVCTMTNTVLTTLNVAHLQRIVETVAELRPARMEWWNYLPMEDFADDRGLIVPMAQLGPALRRALDRARALSIPCAVKYVPMCLLGEHADCVDNAQPDVVIVEAFYDLYPKFSCLWEAKCEHAERCLGLTHAYVHKHGWEETQLHPTPRTSAWQEPTDGLALDSDDPHGDGPTIVHHPRWLALVAGAAEPVGGHLQDLQLDRRRASYRFGIAGGASVEVVLTRRNDERPALVRSASFNLSYRDLVVPDDADPSVRETLASLVRAVARTVVERDRGQMLLDERKGLIGPDALRPRPKRDGR